MVRHRLVRRPHGNDRLRSLLRGWLLFVWVFSVSGLGAAASLLAQPTFGQLEFESAAEPPPAVTGPEFGWHGEELAPAFSSPAAGPLDQAPWRPWPLNLAAIRHNDPNDPTRHVGLGQPLVGTSWRNRPFHVGWLFGGMFGDELIAGRVGQDEDMFGGYRLGWDFDHYWGTEVRVGAAHLDVSDAMLPSQPRSSRNRFGDLNLLYYPWGDAHWRPFVSLGIGGGEFYFRDETGRAVRETALTFPLSAGLKYYWHNWLAWRVSVTDQWSLATGELQSMHNVAFTAGVEVHFGGTRVGYYPYQPSLHLW